MKEEYITYLKEALISYENTPLNYEKSTSTRFPISNVLSRRYLAILATSASIESTFSIENILLLKV
jgi:hypothetical protein